MKIATFIDRDGGLFYPQGDQGKVKVFSYVPDCISQIAEQMEVIVISRGEGDISEELRPKVGQFFHIYNWDGSPESLQDLFLHAQREIDVDLRRSFLVSGDADLIVERCRASGLSFPSLHDGTGCVSQHLRHYGLARTETDIHRGPEGCDEGSRGEGVQG